MGRHWLIPGALLLMVVASALCLGDAPGGEESGVEELAAREVREYEGEDLPSIIEFCDNSIKRPQEDPIAWRWGGRWGSPGNTRMTDS